MSSTHGPSVNFIPPWHVKSNADDNADVLLWADPTTHRLLVDASISSVTITDIEDGDGDSIMDATNDAMKVSIVNDDAGIGGGTQYTEGDTDESITGNALMWEDTSDTLRAVSAAKPLPVDLGTNNDVTVASLPLPSGAATAANQSTIAGHVDGIEALLVTIDTDTSNIAAALPALEGPGAPSVDSYTNAAISASADTADQSLVGAPGSNKQIWVYGIQFTVGTGDGSVSLQDEDNTAISGVMPFAENSGMMVPPSGNFAQPLWKVPTNKALEVDTVTCDIKGSIQYAIVDVS